MEPQCVRVNKESTNENERALFGVKLVKIIAMQGDPYTGKTTIANSLALKLRCPIVRFDDILDSLSPFVNNLETQESHMSQAFDIIAKTVATNTTFGHSVIVDSPLSRRSHLDKILALDTGPTPLPRPTHRSYNDLNEYHDIIRRLVIVECKPKIPYVWETRFKEWNHYSRYDDTKWYKPHEWPHHPRFARDYTENDVRSLVSKVVVDTTNLIQFDVLVNTLQGLNKGEMVELSTDQWRRYTDRPPFYDTPELRNDQYCCKAHEFTYFVEKGVTVDVNCVVCDESVAKSGKVYTCWSCSSAIHKACAELYNTTLFIPKNMPKLVEMESSGKPLFKVPENQLTSRCRQKLCEACVIESHLKTKLVPTIVNHPGHDHRLFYWISRNNSVYMCRVCRGLGNYVGYRCVNDCNANFHVECALLPPVFVEHKHGRHIHDLEMIFGRKRELEEYFCSLCDKSMNPEAWFYCCDNCQLEFHLQCAFTDFDC